MNICLLTGAIGTGKTTYCVDQLIQADEANKKFIKEGNLDKVRKIYSNIDGLKVEHEPLPDDWRDTPKNSIIAIDECHKIDIYQPTRKTLHGDPRIIALNEARHTGHVIYFITQSPKFLHQHIRGLVNQHFHFHNPMGASVATVFMWRHGNTTTPDSEQAKNKAENSFIYSFDKNVQNNFSSVDGDDVQHSKKLKIPRKVIFWACFPLILLGGIAYLLTKPATVGNLTGETFTSKTKKDLENAQATTSQIGQTSTQVNLDLECRKAVNVEKPQCVKWFDDLTKNGSSVNEQGVIAVSYDPNKPYDFEYQPKVQPVDFPRMSGVITLSNGRLMAVDQQGNYMQNISQDDCKRWLSGYRPFNYFAQNQTQQRERSVPEQQQLTSETSSL